MAVKYVFVTGGVVSGLGKGITAASLGRLLKARGYQVTMQKFDPYINVDPGTMNPIQHGEVFVTDDGTETDLDLGHYERFIDESLDKNSNVTTGKIYWSVLQKERHGDYGGGTVQVIPHITNEIKDHFYKAKSEDENRIAIIEVGGTVGDIESQPFLEAIRQFQHEIGHENAVLIHVTLIPYLKASGEMKTKPTQQSVKELQGMGLWPDVLVCRSEYEISEEMKAKIALFCNVPVNHVLQNLDVEYLYEAPLAMEKEHLAQVVCESLQLPCPEPDLTDWKQMVEDLRNPIHEVEIAMVGKYIQLHDAYLSVVEALKHGGIAARANVKIRWVDSEEITPENVAEKLGVNKEWLKHGTNLKPFRSVIQFKYEEGLLQIDCRKKLIFAIRKSESRSEILVIKEIDKLKYEVFPRPLVFHSQVGSEGRRQLYATYNFLKKVYIENQFCLNYVYFVPENVFNDLIEGKCYPGIVKEYLSNNKINILFDFVESDTGESIKYLSDLYGVEFVAAKNIIKNFLSKEEIDEKVSVEAF